VGGLMSDENLLSDIENDIFGDWEDIQKKIRDKEIEKRVENGELNPQRINCPDFKQFYIRLLRILQSWNDIREISPNSLFDLHDILNMVFSGIDDWSNPMPESFYKVWELFCSPRHYRCDRNVICERCGKTYDIFIKKINIEYQYYNQFEFENAYHMTQTITNVLCPNCGCDLRGYVDGKILGIFIHDGEHKYDFRREFKQNF
jgi:hypothetical protein